MIESLERDLTNSIDRLIQMGIDLYADSNASDEDLDIIDGVAGAWKTYLKETKRPMCGNCIGAGYIRKPDNIVDCEECGGSGYVNDNQSEIKPNKL